MTDDDLRDALARLDPVPPGVPVDPDQDARVHELMETAMSSTENTPAAPGAGRGRTGLVAAAAVAVLAVGGVGTYALTSGDGEAPGGSGSTVTLAVSASDPFASCLRPEPEMLAGFPVAFAGTVTEVTPETVTVDVSRWYVGGDADTVTLQGTGASAALTGVEFAGGEDVLVSAVDGTVTSCGFSGTASPELQAFYDEAFPG